MVKAPLERFSHSHKWPNGAVGKAIAAMASWQAALHEYGNYLGSLIIVIAISCILLFLSGISYWFGALVFRSAVEIQRIFLVIPTILLLGGLPVSIGGWGIQELSAAVVFNSAGLGTALGLSGALLIRTKTVAIALIGGVLYLLPWRPQTFQSIG